MQGVDTNVVVRLLVEDDPQQSQQAILLWRKAIEQGGVFLSKIVLVETVWVLSVSYRFDRTTIVSVIHALLQTEGVMVECEAQVLAALNAFADGAADFSDYLILETARDHDALPVHSFDRRFAKTDKVALVSDTK